MRSLLFLTLGLTAAVLVTADVIKRPKGGHPPPYYTTPPMRIPRHSRSADSEPMETFFHQEESPLSEAERRALSNPEPMDTFFHQEDSPLSEAERRALSNPEPMETFFHQEENPLSEAERRAINCEYKKIWEEMYGDMPESGGIKLLPDDPYRGFIGILRFRRSADPEPQGSIVLQGQKPLSGPDRRPTYNLDYQHNIWQGKNGQVSAGGGAVKLPGQRVQPHVGIQGTWRFRRSADPEPQGSIVLQGQKPLSGPDRRPTYNLDYQHNIWQGKNGQVSAGGGALKLPGQRVQPHVGIQGTWRFRRSADPEPQGSIVLQGQKPLSGPDRRPTYNLDYQHNIWQGKNGQVSAGGGALKLPGQRVQPHVGIQGTWRFRRSADPEPQGSIVLQGQKPLSGPDRRPTYNLDYQHNIWQGKNGQVSAGGGALKLPGQRVQPHVGIQGTWRFRRSADAEA